MRLDLLNVDPSDETSIDDYHGVESAAWAATVPDMPAPTRAHIAAQLRYPRPTSDVIWLTARVDATPVATLRLSLPLADNTRTGLVDLSVHPAHRRRGIGRELFSRCVEVVRGHGRNLLIGVYCDALPGGPERDPAPAAFAAAMGVQRALTEVRSRLDVGAADRDLWRAAYDDALTRAKGYTVLAWTGAVPEQHLADIAYLESRMVGDAPSGKLQYEPENIDAERMRATDKVQRRRGVATFHAAARDDATGRIVAWTALEFGVGQTSHAQQETTIVDPDHRGHRLGLLVKLENLTRTLAVQPGLRYVDTWNAAENTHMIAINQEIGFRPVDAWVDWQYEIPAVA